MIQLTLKDGSIRELEAPQAAVRLAGLSRRRALWSR